MIPLLTFLLGATLGVAVSFIMYQRTFKNQREKLHGKDMVINSLKLHYGTIGNKDPQSKSTHE